MNAWGQKAGTHRGRRGAHTLRELKVCRRGQQDFLTRGPVRTAWQSGLSVLGQLKQAVSRHVRSQRYCALKPCLLSNISALLSLSPGRMSPHAQSKIILVIFASNTPYKIISNFTCPATLASFAFFPGISVFYWIFVFWLLVFLWSLHYIFYLSVTMVSWPLSISQRTQKNMNN